ncbi:hypothetical protein B566_EDAN016149 [Ephemera danica]|nr:hypothetical protein B566_EDAN016149 [Ephemera danica]
MIFVLTDKQSLISDAGKLSILDGMLRRLKSQGHRVLIYSQMTKMIDLLEEFMYYRKHTYMRLDGSSKISERRDMVADFQNREDIFVFLLSTRAGGLGINLTAADTVIFYDSDWNPTVDQQAMDRAHRLGQTKQVIFYDSDWNPTVDQQAMDRAHRLGQTKQVTVYRLICKDTIEERILQRAQEKSEIQRMVISGGSFKPDTLKPTEVVSLLLDDAEIERKYRQKQAERRGMEERKPQQPASVQPKVRGNVLNLSPDITLNDIGDFDSKLKPCHLSINILEFKLRFMSWSLLNSWRRTHQDQQVPQWETTTANATLLLTLRVCHQPAYLQPREEGLIYNQPVSLF